MQCQCCNEVYPDFAEHKCKTGIEQQVSPNSNIPTPSDNLARLNTIRYIWYTREPETHVVQDIKWLIDFIEQQKTDLSLAQKRISELEKAMTYLIDRRNWKHLDERPYTLEEFLTAITNSMRKEGTE